MSKPPQNDIPPARRQATEIPMAEIEAATTVAPKQRSRGKLLGLIAILGIGGVSVWQWERISPYLGPVGEAIGTSAQAAIAKGKAAAGDLNLPGMGNDLEETGRHPQVEAVATKTDIASSDLETPPPPETPRTTESSQAIAQPSPSNPTTPDDINTSPEQLLNHRRYDVAPADQLVALNPNSIIRLRPAAQAKVSAMLNKAKIEGVRLGVVSGFRTIEDQNYLFFEVKEERGQTAKTRANVSAPPGYSEHHTGYALDFIDETRPDAVLNQNFENTPAFKWLEKNAAFFGFEMSFPNDSTSKVAYEPWHWRYVGDQESLELFYREQSPQAAQ